MGISDAWFERFLRVLEADTRGMRQISIEAGCGINYVQQLVKDRKEPTLSRFVRVLEVLGAASTRYVIEGGTEEQYLANGPLLGRDVSKTKQDDSVLPPEMSPEAIGKRMKQLREAYGLKSSEIADQISIDRSHWTRFEKGQRPVSNECAWKLVQRFGITLDWLMVGRIDKLPYEVAEKLRIAGAGG